MTNPIPLAPRRLILGLDIGGTKLAAGILDGKGRLLSYERIATMAADGPDAVLQRLATLGFRAIESAGVSVRDLDGIGVGCGGPLDARRGVVLSPPNLPGWDDVHVTEWLEHAFGLPAWLDNDGNAGVLGEARFGAARASGNAVFLTVSTGVGGGVISDGRIVHGASGNAAELGHLCVAVNGRRCGCGARGCLEAYASGTSIAARAREAIDAGEPTALAEMAGPAGIVTAEMVVGAVREGDAVAARIWDETIDALAAGIASAIHAFNPQVVVLGGGVTNAADLLIEPLRERVASRTMPALAAGTRIEISSLGERLGVYGAAAVALERLGTAARRQIQQSTAAEPDPCAAHAIAEHADVVRAVGEQLADRIDEFGEILCAALGRGGRLIAFGNGGSAADAQHFVAELIGHFRRDRGALPAIALTTDPSVITAIANDYSYADVFARQVEALAGPDDVVVGISTSGNAANVVRGLLAARLRGATTVGLTGGSGGSVARVAEHAIVVPSTTTSRIQEMHTLIVHVVSDRVDEWAAAREQGSTDSRVIPIDGRRDGTRDHNPPVSIGFGTASRSQRRRPKLVRSRRSRS